MSAALTAASGVGASGPSESWLGSVGITTTREARLSSIPTGDRRSTRLSLLARSWIPVLAIAAILLAPPGAAFNSTYAARWLAAGLVLVAAVGRKSRTASLAAVGLSTAGALYVGIDNLVRITGGGSPARWLHVVGAAVVVAVALRQLLTGIRRDPLMVVAVQLAVGLVSHWAYYQVGGLALDYRSYGRDSLQSLGGSELSFVALALAGAGLGVFRTWRPAIERLGWTPATWWQIALGFLIAQVFLLSNYPADVLTYLLMPDALRAIAVTSQHVFVGLPWWTFPIFAAMAAAGEETLFRGALQPKFGIVLTAALFAMIHVQYGTTPILGMVFVHGLVYGLLRRHLNTTTAAFAHFSYDVGAFLSPGYPTDGFLAAVTAALLVGPAWRNRRLIWRTLSEGFISDWTRFVPLHT